MLTRQQILALIPHQGTMCLLDRVTAWSEDGVTCTATSHLAPDNPLRRGGRLGAICGVEYGLQAAALHGALLAGAPGAEDARRAVQGDGGGDGPAARPGYLAALRQVTLHVDCLDETAFGPLRVTATRELHAASGSIYRFAIHAADGMSLVDGRGTIAFAETAA